MTYKPPVSVIWFVGLSGAGKSTLATGLADKLKKSSLPVQLLDGDEIRRLKPHLGFSRSDRVAHNKAIVESLLVSQPLNSIVSTIAPFEEIRHFNRSRIKNYFEIYVSTPLEVCMQRDPKGLYRAHAKGLIREMTGLDQAFEVPQKADFSIDTTDLSPDECIQRIYDQLPSAPWRLQ